MGESDQGATPAWANVIIARLDQMDAKIRQIDAKIDANHARTRNAIFNFYCPDILLPIVKYDPGHPAVVPPPKFQFDRQQYTVGMLPPHGLVPETLLGIRAIKTHARLNAIHWFYNDPSLAANKRSVIERRAALEKFLKCF